MPSGFRECGYDRRCVAHGPLLDGFGNQTPLEDAITLFESFRKHSGVAGALKSFELTRKPVIEAYQAAAYESMTWFENARQLCTSVRLSWLMR